VVAGHEKNVFFSCSRNMRERRRRRSSGHGRANGGAVRGRHHP
jgi:hypothetical protein